MAMIYTGSSDRGPTRALAACALATPEGRQANLTLSSAKPAFGPLGTSRFSRSQPKPKWLHGGPNQQLQDAPRQTNWCALR